MHFKCIIAVDSTHLRPAIVIQSYKIALSRSDWCISSTFASVMKYTRKTNCVISSLPLTVLLHCLTSNLTIFVPFTFSPLQFWWMMCRLMFHILSNNCILVAVHLCMCYKQQQQQQKRSTVCQRRAGSTVIITILRVTETEAVPYRFDAIIPLVCKTQIDDYFFLLFLFLENSYEQKKKSNETLCNGPKIRDLIKMRFHLDELILCIFVFCCRGCCSRCSLPYFHNLICR